MVPPPSAWNEEWPRRPRGRLGGRSGPALESAEPTGEEQDIGTAGWSEEMTFVDGEKAVERARDTERAHATWVRSDHGT